MPRSKPPYPAEYREEIIELVRSGQSPGEVAKKFEPSAQTIRNWVHEATAKDGRRQDGVARSESDELRRLRREVKRLQQERDILAKAAAWFARETGSIPSGSSSS